MDKAKIVIILEILCLINTAICCAISLSELAAHKVWLADRLDLWMDSLWHELHKEYGGDD